MLRKKITSLILIGCVLALCFYYTTYAKYVVTTPVITNHEINVNITTSSSESQAGRWLQNRYFFRSDKTSDQGYGPNARFGAYMLTNSFTPTETTTYIENTVYTILGTYDSFAKYYNGKGVETGAVNGIGTVQFHLYPYNWTVARTSNIQRIKFVFYLANNSIDYFILPSAISGPGVGGNYKIERFPKDSRFAAISFDASDSLKADPTYSRFDISMPVAKTINGVNYGYNRNGVYASFALTEIIIIGNS